jgi:hypothetical protein
MSSEHFSRDLRVSGFIRPDQAEVTQTPEKEERAEADNQQPVRL